MKPEDIESDRELVREWFAENDGCSWAAPPAQALRVGDSVMIHDGSTRRPATVKHLGNLAGELVVIPDAVPAPTPMTDLKRLYIAGPMSNLPGYNLPAFAQAADQLTAAGFDAVNPGRHGVDPAYTWSDYLRRGLTELLTCDGVAMLPGWEDSCGAQLEHHVAMKLGMDIRYVDEWLETK